MQLTGGVAVLLQLIDLHGAVGVGELGEAIGAQRELDVAKQVAIDGEIGQGQARERRRGFAVRIERERRADVLPGRFCPGRVRIGLVEQLPGIAAGRAADFGPTELDVDRVAFEIVGGDGAAVGGSAVKVETSLPIPVSLAGKAVRVSMPNFAAEAVPPTVMPAVGSIAVSVMSPSAVLTDPGHAAAALDRGLQLRQRCHLAGSGAERDGLRSSRCRR